jgi:intraflagellar transport protein 172
LIKSGLYEKAGEFYERMNLLNKALEAYCKGNAYNKAVALGKRTN